MTFYTSLFDEAEVLELTRFGPEPPGAEGLVMRGSFSLAGQVFLCTDSPIAHDFTFTPSFSVWIDVSSEEELQRLHATLTDGGAELMPPDDYGFSRRFTWVSDRFGVSWQLNLA